MKIYFVLVILELGLANTIIGPVKNEIMVDLEARVFWYVHVHSSFE